MIADNVVYCDHYNGKCMMIRTADCDDSKGSPGTCLGFKCCYHCAFIKDCLEKKQVCPHMKWDIEHHGNLRTLMAIGKKITVRPLFEMLNDSREEK